MIGFLFLLLFMVVEGEAANFHFSPWEAGYRTDR